MSDNIQRSLITPAPTPRNQLIGEFVWETLDQYADRQLLVNYSTDQGYTGRTLKERVETVALHFMGLGIKPRDVITLYSTNSMEVLVVILAAFRLGATVALLNAMAVTGDVNREVTRCESTLLFTDTACVKNAIKGCINTPIKHIVINGNSPGCISLSTMEERPRGVHLPSLQGLGLDPKEDVACILFSSGTTGLPKPVLIPHSVLTYAVDVIAHPSYELSGTHLPVFQPIAHIMGLDACLSGLRTGDCVIVIEKFKLEEYIQIVSKYKVSNLVLVPPISVLLAKSGLTKKYDLSCVKSILNGSAPLPVEVAGDLKRQFGGKIQMKQAYGLTESCGIFTYAPSGPYAHLDRALHPGSVGVLGTGVEGKIVDPETGKALGPEQEGEICMRTPTLMLRYLNNPQATAETIDKDGWLHSGDIGYYDSNGCWYVVDRIKELIKYKGNQVAPSELENVLLKHPAVADAGVIGVPDPDLVAGELPMAWVVLKPNHKATEREIADFVAGEISPYKKLRGGVRFVQMIPKSPSGKILRRFMKDKMKEEVKHKKAKL